MLSMDEAVYEETAVTSGFNNYENCGSQYPRTQKGRLNVYTTGKSNQSYHTTSVENNGNPTPNEQSSDNYEPRNQSPNFKWKTAAVVFAIFMLSLQTILFAFSLAGFFKDASENPTSSESTVLRSILPDHRSSCLQLKENGVTKSGYYYLASDDKSGTYQTYCDMETSGGGWTLVATINDNNVRRKCSLDDSWFSNEDLDVQHPYSQQLTLQ